VSARIFTGAWTSLWRASQAGPLPVQPVRISRGVPKFWPAAEHFPAVPALMPDPWMLGVAKADADLERFGRCYRRKLHIIGLPTIQAELDALGARYGKPLCLMCFEQNPATCHRGPLGFGGWYERATGIAVPEVELAVRAGDPDKTTTPPESAKPQQTPALSPATSVRLRTSGRLRLFDEDTTRKDPR
jgi:hypothetical protein